MPPVFVYPVDKICCPNADLYPVIHGMVGVWTW